MLGLLSHVALEGKPSTKSRICNIQVILVGTDSEPPSPDIHFMKRNIYKCHSQMINRVRQLMSRKISGLLP